MRALQFAALGTDFRNLPGAGAAGGLGFVFVSYLRGELKPGIELVMDALKLEGCVRNADFVVTGEGCLDGQTAFGKTPAGVAAAAKRYGVPVIALAGKLTHIFPFCHASCLWRRRWSGRPHAPIWRTR
ncbi:MAG: glycerate kinase [Butyricicoccaceae bacterium]